MSEQDELLDELEEELANDAPTNSSGGDDEDILDVDLSEAVDRESLVGRYLVEIIETEPKRSSKTNKPMLKLTLKVVDGEKAGRLCWKNLMLSGKGSGIMRDALTGFGAGIDWTVDKPQIKRSALVGLMAYANCKASSGTGSTEGGTDVGKIEPYEGVALDEDDE